MQKTRQRKRAKVRLAPGGPGACKIRAKRHVPPFCQTGNAKRSTPRESYEREVALYGQSLPAIRRG
jgi:hypothetical protein